jgi:hypothetical protein
LCEEEQDEGVGREVRRGIAEFMRVREESRREEE